jgi:hypothetical protein
MADFITSDNLGIFERQLIDAKTGNPFDLTGFTPQLCYRVNAGTLKTRTMVVGTPSTNGIVQYYWTTGDFDAPGNVEAEIKLTKSGSSLTTKDVIKFTVRNALD